MCCECIRVRISGAIRDSNQVAHARYSFFLQLQLCRHGKGSDDVEFKDGMSVRNWDVAGKDITALNAKLGANKKVKGLNFVLWAHRRWENIFQFEFAWTFFLATFHIKSHFFCFIFCQVFKEKKRIKQSSEKTFEEAEHPLNIW